MDKKTAQKTENIFLNIFSFLLKTVSKNLKAFSLKKVSDYIFIIIEKIIVKFPSLLTAYIVYYEDIVENEVRLAEITSQDTVLHIGCGSLPSTSLLIAKKTHAHTIGIDKDTSSIQDARSCVRVLHQEDLVQLHQANALQYPTGSSTVLIVSQGIEPRYDVLRYISKTMRRDTRVLYRTFCSETNGITSQDAVLSTFFLVKGTVLHPEHGLLMSILLKKKIK